MKGEGVNLVAICLVAAIGLSLYVGRMQAAVTLPPEDKQLKRQFYKKMNTCVNVEAFVKHQVQLSWAKDKSITAKLLKLLYADCLVNGCDASILLEGPGTEKKAPQNRRLDGFALIDNIKRTVESRCPLVVSCADILNLAVRDALHLAGAPSYPVLLGRRDGKDSRAKWVDLPPPSISWEKGVDYFKSKGLDEQDYATLLGAHTMGKAHCSSIYDRLYNWRNTKKPDPSMSKALSEKLRQQCPKVVVPKKDPTVFLTDKNGEQYRFTNNYYSNVLSHDSVLRADQELLYGYNTSQLVLEYAGSFEQLRRQFSLSVSRLGGLKVLTGTDGEIRQNCRFTNPTQLLH
ncbi:hypothetical protein ACP275_14G306000 [Erythranthe tilingii]